MASIAYLASSSNGASPTSKSWAQPIVSAINKLLVICVSVEDAGGITSVTAQYPGFDGNGDPAVLNKTASLAVSAVTGSNRASIYYLLNQDLPTIGDVTITVATSESTDGTHGTSILFGGAKQVSPSYTNTSVSSASTSLANTVTKVAGGVHVDASEFSEQGRTVTFDTGQTLVQASNVGGHSSGAAYQLASSANSSSEISTIEGADTICALASAAWIPAPVIYVDGNLTADCTTGNYSISNRNCTGSDGDAYISLTDGCDNMSVGDTLLIRGGTYAETGYPISGTSGAANRIIISGYPGEMPKIDGGHTRNSGFYAEQADYITIEQVYITGCNAKGINLGGDPGTTASNVELRYILGDDCGQSVIVLNNSDDCIVEYCVAARCGNFGNSWSSGINVVTPVGDANVVFNCVSFHSVDISGNFTDGNGFIVDYGLTNGTCRFYNNLAFLNGGGGIVVTNTAGAIVRFNTCAENSKHNLGYDYLHGEINLGSSQNSATNAVIQNNALSRVDAEIVSLIHYTQPLVNCTIDHNYLYDDPETSSPQFVAESDANYKIAGASPLVGAATQIAGLAADIGFDHKLLKDSTSPPYTWWLFELDITYLVSLPNRMRDIFKPYVPVTRNDIGAFEFRGTTTLSPMSRISGASILNASVPSTGGVAPTTATALPSFQPISTGSELIPPALSADTSISPLGSTSAVAFISSATNGSSPTSKSWTHYCDASSNKLLVICVSIESAGGIQGVDVSGTAATQAVTAIGGGRQAHIYYVLDADLPDNANVTITVTTTESTDGTHGNSVLFSNVIQGVPSQTANTVDGAATSVSNSITTVSGGVHVDALECGDAGRVVLFNTGQTGLQQSNVGGHSSNAGYELHPSGGTSDETVAISGTASVLCLASAVWAPIAVSVTSVYPPTRSADGSIQSPSYTTDHNIIASTKGAASGVQSYSVDIGSELISATQMTAAPELQQHVTGGSTTPTVMSVDVDTQAVTLQPGAYVDSPSVMVANAGVQAYSADVMLDFIYPDGMSAAASTAAPQAQVGVYIITPPAKTAESAISTQAVSSLYTIPSYDDLVTARNYLLGWSKRGALTITIDPLVENIDGYMGTSKISNLGAFSVDDTYTILSSEFESTAYIPSFYIQKNAESSVLVVANPVNYNLGLMTVDLSAIPAGWVKVSPSGQGVSVVNEFITSGSGGCGIHLYSYVGDTFGDIYVSGASVIVIDGTLLMDIGASIPQVNEVYSANPSALLSGASLPGYSVSEGAIITTPEVMTASASALDGTVVSLGVELSPDQVVGAPAIHAHDANVSAIVVSPEIVSVASIAGYAVSKGAVIVAPNAVVADLVQNGIQQIDIAINSPSFLIAADLPQYKASSDSLVNPALVSFSAEVIVTSHIANNPHIYQGGAPGSFKMSILTDLDIFFDIEEFAITVTINGSEVIGIFDDEWTFVPVGDAGVSSTAPAIICKTVDVSTVAFGDELVNGATHYNIVDFQSNGTGLTVLILELAA